MVANAVVVAILALFTTSLPQVTDPATLGASIKYEKNYSLLAPCINQCIWDIGDNDTPDIGGDLAYHLSCGGNWPNGCYCRPQSASIAHSFITSCASYLCTTPQQSDIDLGTSVYASYCSAALGGAYNPEGVDQQAAPTSAGTGPSSAGGVAATTRPTSTIPKQTDASNPSNSDPANTASSDSSQNPGDEKIAGLSKGAFIGVVVSASCSVLGLLFGIAFKVYKHKKQTKMQQQRHMGPAGVYYTTKQ